jgi:hypothetical protein
VPTSTSTARSSTASVYVADTDQPGALVDELGRRRGVELLALVVRDREDLGPRPLHGLRLGEHGVLPY